MHKSRSMGLLYMLALCWLAGCGGVGNSLSGGSVPIGGRTVTGTALLPDSTPAANAIVTIRSLPSGNLVQATTTDSSGRFTLKGVPTNSDMDVIIMQPPSNTLEAIVSLSELTSNPNQPLNIGDINALSTVVAAAIKLEQAPAPEDADSIVFNQVSLLDFQVHDADYSIDTQKQLISDPNSLNAQALALMVPTANSELTAFVTTPNSSTADTALNGLLAYMRCTHARGIHLSKSLRDSLINAQLMGTLYSPDRIASALQAAGVRQVTATEVSAASQRERSQLTALNNLGGGITAFEALVIG